ncbi:hypothetical protein HDU93_002791 [Gonapodya sp. JEL0774]|nr:hypothetical protein HDU93_002791 [Gonapodya sp. JEL0774]
MASSSTAPLPGLPVFVAYLRKSKDESKGQSISIDTQDKRAAACSVARNHSSIRRDLKQRGHGLHQTFFQNIKSGGRPPGLGKKDRDGLERALTLACGDHDASDASPAMKMGKRGAMATLDEDGNTGCMTAIASYRLDCLARDACVFFGVEERLRAADKTFKSRSLNQRALLDRFFHMATRTLCIFSSPRFGQRCRMLRLEREPRTASLIFNVLVAVQG